MSDADHRTLSDHLQRLESLMADLQSQRAAAVRHLAVAHGADAELLAVTLKRLDERVEAGRSELATLRERARRVARMSELTVEMRTTRLELEALAQRGDKGARFDELRARAVALHAEANELRNPPK